MVTDFKNLYEFFSYMEFCPLCEKRMVPVANVKYALTGKKFILYNRNDLPLEIDLVDNSFAYVDPPPAYINMFTNGIRVIVGQQCRKYHYQYDGSICLKMDSCTIDKVWMEKEHILEKLGNSYFTINIHYQPVECTKVRVTAGGHETREFVFNSTDFDFSTRKKIQNKLKTIELLG